MANNQATYVVYMHTTPSGRRYVGMTCKDPKNRWEKGNGYRNQKYFYLAIQKYGWDNIQHDVLFSALPKEEAEQKERELISLYHSADRRYGYNIDLGGKSKGRCSEETKKLISERQKGWRPSEYMLQRAKEVNTGRPCSKETREKIGLAQIGKKVSDEAKLKMSNSHKGKHLADSHKEHISEKVKKGWTAERRKHMSEISKGRKGPTWSEEQIQWYRDNNRGEKSVLSKKVGQFDLKGNLICTFGSAREAGRDGFTYSGVSAVCRGEKHTHHGFVWKYLEE